ncbi:hypothetical protein [Telmatospirillum sp. J64-1]|uniref:hypothetical protein n=1 Tax=Telmatospirillum sp. J64-1 TaxID=2502183 RepID=UPI00115E72A9|nr:hypothetical protein [Telmatospirillum sp. J64-1]
MAAVGPQPALKPSEHEERSWLRPSRSPESWARLETAIETMLHHVPHLNMRYRSDHYDTSQVEAIRKTTSATLARFVTADATSPLAALRPSIF